MENYGEHINNLINEFSNLPGVGKKSAIRLAFHIINSSKEDVYRLADAIKTARDKTKRCKLCQTITDDELCSVCADVERDHGIIMVVETTADMMAYERTGRYEGVYHVLNGVISPRLNTGPSDITLKELMIRLQGDVKELIIATNSDLEGETTAMYISKLVKGIGIKITRIASGVPVGGDIENIDEVTLLRALDGRFEI